MEIFETDTLIIKILETSSNLSIMFKPDDFVIVKPGTKNLSGEVVNDWGGQIFAIKTKERLAFVALDAISMASMSDTYLTDCINENYVSVEHPFSFDELEMSDARNTEQEVKEAIETLVDRELELEGHEGDISTLADFWVNEFTQSPIFNALEEPLKENVDFVAHTFIDHMYNYEFAEPDEWTPSNVKNACLGVIPSKVTAEIEFFESYGKVLIEFLKFLGEKEYIQNSIDLILVVEQIKKQIPIVASNPNNWGMAKTMMMNARKEGIDLGDQEAINRFLQTQSGLAKLPPFPGTPPPRLVPLHNPFKGIGRNEKVSVQYPDGRVVENIKFKKVEKELKEGNCELVG